jgi:hypothetical protein
VGGVNPQCELVYLRRNAPNAVAPSRGVIALDDAYHHVVAGNSCQERGVRMSEGD